MLEDTVRLLSRCSSSLRLLEHLLADFGKALAFET